MKIEIQRAIAIFLHFNVRKYSATHNNRGHLTEKQL